jgi:hypothetical protein
MKKIWKVFINIITLGGFNHYIFQKREYEEFKLVAEKYNEYRAEVFNYIKELVAINTNQQVINHYYSVVEQLNKTNDNFNGNVSLMTQCYLDKINYIEESCHNIPYFKVILRDKSIESILEEIN